VAATASELLTSANEAAAAGDFDAAFAAATESLALDELGGARFLLGTLLYQHENFAEAKEHWEAAFRLLRDAGDLQAAATVAIRLASLSVSWLGHEAAGGGWAERARMLLDRVGPCVEWGYLELASLACDRQDIGALLVSTDRALSLALEFGDSDLEALAMSDSGLALVTQGQTHAGFARLDAAMAAIGAGEVTSAAAGICFCSMLTACDRASDLRRATEWTRLMEGLLEQNGDRPKVLRTHCSLAYGSVLCAAGRWPEAEALMLAALGPSDAPNLAHRATTVAHLAGLRIEQGRVEEAADLLAPFEDRVASCLPLAQVHLRRWDLDLAAAVLRRGLQELAADVLRAAPLLLGLVDVELRRGDIDAARAAAADLAAMARDVDLAVIRADAAIADGRVLEALGDHTAAIDAYCSAKAHLGEDDRPMRLGLVRLELAEVLAAAGDAPGAIVEARAALATFERLGATTARDRASALLRSLGDTGRNRPQQADELSAALTRREREVLDLVRDGLTNAEIAERLYISPKTAEHHVGRILTKLGVRSRAEAAALAVRLAATPD
jgi:DNA-binding CsgD family transcriptional regulator